jgi:hypothetical protein
LSVLLFLGGGGGPTETPPFINGCRIGESNHITTQPLQRRRYPILERPPLTRLTSGVDHSSCANTCRCKRTKHEGYRLPRVSANTTMKDDGPGKKSLLQKQNKTNKQNKHTKNETWTPGGGERRLQLSSTRHKKHTRHCRHKSIPRAVSKRR